MLPRCNRDERVEPLFSTTRNLLFGNLPAKRVDSVAGYQFMVFAEDGLNSFTGVRSNKGQSSRVPKDLIDSVSIPCSCLASPLPTVLLSCCQFQFHLAHAMPQTDRQTSHHRHDGDLFLFRISQYQLLIKPPAVGVMADMHPAGLA